MALIAMLSAGAAAPAVRDTSDAMVTSAPTKRMLVICAPGYPGNTADAQATMDDLAGALAAAGGWSPEHLGAVYHETLEGGIRRLQQPDAVAALVPLPLFMEHGRALDLRPVLQAVATDGSRHETWSLVAARGKLARTADLDGWEITGMPGYAPDFVRRVLLGDWGEIPASARITFAARVVSALRRAAAGEPIAVILDAAQTRSLGSLPFSDRLEIVTRSRPLPGNMLCMVGDRLPAGETGDLRNAFLGLHAEKSAREVLLTMRIKRFRPAELEALPPAC